MSPSVTLANCINYTVTCNDAMLYGDFNAFFIVVRVTVQDLTLISVAMLKSTSYILDVGEMPQCPESVSLLNTIIFNSINIERLR